MSIDVSKHTARQLPSAAIKSRPLRGDDGACGLLGACGLMWGLVRGLLLAEAGRAWVWGTAWVCIWVWGMG